MPETELEILAGWLAKGHKAALATVISTWGSAPRPVGSLLVIRDDGNFAGSVSAGCVEGAVIEAARGAIVDGKTRDLSFGVDNHTAFAVGLTCGGTIRVHIDPGTNRDVLNQALDFHNGRNSFLRSFCLDAPGWQVSGAAELVEDDNWLDDDQKTFRHVIVPSPRLIIFGAVHIAQYLAAMARMTGYDVTVVDPRTAYGAPERFQDVHILPCWPDEALAALKPDHRTAIVLLTHDAKLDDPALMGALATPAFYIAALGSRKNHAARLLRLAEAGLAPLQLERIHGPAGLAIGALSPAEIALSILAELTAARRNRTVEPAQRLMNPAA